MIASGFSWFNVIPALDQNVAASLGGADYNVSITLAHAWVSCFAVLGFAFIARMGLSRANARQGIERFTADDRLTPRTMAEIWGSFVLNMMGDVMPKKEVKTYAPFIATIFAYVLACNLQGLVPGFLPPTDNINTNIGMALASFVCFMWVGLTRDAVGFVKHLMGPVALLIPLLFPLEALSLVLRPLTLSLRLTGNMFGDHLVFTIMSTLVPIGLPALLLALATFVSFMQAFIFSLLSSVYIGLSLPHEHHHDEGHHAH